MDVKKILYIVSIAVLLIVTGVLGIASSAEYNKLGRLNNRLAERVNDAEDTNRRLTETIEQCKSICGDLEQSVNRNISTAADAVNMLEEIREEVYALESVTGNFDISQYYSDTDKYLGIE